jgi:glutathione S-transferase
MKLFYFPGSCALAPHIVAREANLDITIEKVDTKEMRTEAGVDYRTINAKGYVPVLQLDDGQFLTEAAVIVQYLADRKPESKLVPAWGTLERYRQQEWLNYVATELHKLYYPLFKNGAAETQELARTQLAERLDYLSKQLDGKDYLMGTFTAADAYLYTVLRWTRVVKFDTSKWPVIEAYMKRVRERPGVQTALRAEGLLKP